MIGHKDYSAGGASAGEKAGRDMIARCGPLGNHTFANFVDGMTKATGEALDRMRSAGATPKQLKAWTDGFDQALKPFLARMQMIENQTGKG